MKYYYTIIEITNDKNKNFYQIEIRDTQTDKIVYKTTIREQKEINKINKLSQYLNKKDINKIKDYLFNNFCDNHINNINSKINENKIPNTITRLLFAPYAEFFAIRLIIFIILSIFTISILIVLLGEKEIYIIEFYLYILYFILVSIYMGYESLANKYFIKNYVKYINNRGIAIIYEENEIDK